MTKIYGQGPEQNPRRMLRAAKPFAIHAILFSVVCILTLAGVLEPLNHAMMDMRFRMLPRAPSDTLVIVEIDPISLKEEERWPWPRDRYATVISNLQNAGALLIALDVDFSSLSDDAGDAALVEALSRRPGEIVLPVFSQWASPGGRDSLVIKTPPHSLFLQDSVVATVNLTAEKNGLVRRGWRGLKDQQSYHASMAAILAGSQGTRQDAFHIDYGFDLSKIDRLSFVDVVRGDFPASVVDGKNILIGATAIELGDEFVAPNLGVIPGVMLHALSYESLVQGRALERLHFSIPLIGALIVIILICRKDKNRNWRKTIRNQLFLFSGLVGAPIILQSAAPLSFDAGSMIAAQGLCIIYMIGVTLRRHTQQIFIQRAATARYQALTSLVVRDNTDGVIIADANGVIELCNDRANDLLGAAGAMIPGARVQTFAKDFPLYPSDKQATQYHTASKSGDKPILCEYLVKGSSNLTVEIVARCSSQVSCVTGLNGEEKQRAVFVYTLRDISARKRIEAAEMAAKQAAIDANRFKSELIANMSHELRTPLNGVIGFADILQKESFGPLGMPEYKEYSEHIYTSGKRLLNLVNDMLNIAKLDSDDYEICKNLVSLDDVIEDCLSDIDNREARESVTVDIQHDLSNLNIDYEIFKEILSHLLSNAMKYTDDDPEISIRAFQQAHDLVIEVKDNGRGVEADMLPMLTKAFFQADSKLNRHHEGAGIGLYLASKLAFLHDGGTLEFESEKGVGFLARLRFSGITMKHRQSAA